MVAKPSYFGFCGVSPEISISSCSSTAAYYNRPGLTVLQETAVVRSTPYGPRMLNDWTIAD